MLIHSNLFKPKINEVSNRLTSDKNEDNIAIEDRLLLHGQMYGFKAKLREDILIKDKERECSHIYTNNNDHYHAKLLSDKSSDVNDVPIHARTIGIHTYVLIHTHSYIHIHNYSYILTHIHTIGKMKISIPKKKEYKKTTQGMRCSAPLSYDYGCLVFCSFIFFTIFVLFRFVNCVADCICVYVCTCVCVHRWVFD